MKYNQEQCEVIGETIIDCAYRIFEDCGKSEDFCVQDVSGNVFVFGSTNRLLYHPFTGFRPDTSYCTKNFIDTFNSLYGRAGR